MNDVTVVVPTIRERLLDMLPRALASIQAQTVPCGAVIVTDVEGEGAAATRNRGIMAVETEWTAFLDDDDELYPQHVEHCLDWARHERADLVYPWFDGPNSSGILSVVVDGVRVTPEGRRYERSWDAHLLTDVRWEDGRDVWNFIPITVLVKTELLQRVGGCPVPGTKDWPHPNCEDHGLWIRLLREGAVFAHLPERTWMYHVHGQNTSGQPR